MAASMKRPHEDDSNQETFNKKPLLDNEKNIDNELQIFLKWCKQNDFNLSSKVTVQRKGSCAQYGMIALDDIADGYCLFQIPRTCLLAPQNTDIGHLIEKDAALIDVQNKWIPLLLCLLHEQNKPDSKWRPYLDLVPDYKSLDLPLFWDRKALDNLLTNSRVDHAVERDLKMIQDDYEKIVIPFFERHKELRADLRDVEYFKKMVAFIMSYSFTEPQETEKAKNGNGDENDSDDSSDDEESGQNMSPPMMVPMADMLNHVTKHNAKLTFGEEALKMVTIRNIKKGEEIFNTYGEVSNFHLMHMYGFTEHYPENIHDVVEIPIDRLLDAATQLWGPEDNGVVASLQEKWKYMLDQDFLSDDDVFVLNGDGIITDEICLQALKVLCMKPDEFADYQEKDGWSDAESDSSLSGESKLSFEKIPKLEETWVSLLKRMAVIHIGKYKTSPTEDTNKLNQLASLTKREKYSLYLVHRQKMLLQKLINVCDSYSYASQPS